MLMTTHNPSSAAALAAGVYAAGHLRMTVCQGRQGGLGGPNRGRVAGDHSPGGQGTFKAGVRGQNASAEPLAISSLGLRAGEVSCILFWYPKGIERVCRCLRC